MADITKCSDTNCKLKDTCYRFIAPASELQSYFMKSPRVGSVCAEYWNRKVN